MKPPMDRVRSRTTGTSLKPFLSSFYLGSVLRSLSLTSLRLCVPFLDSRSPSNSTFSGTGFHSRRQSSRQLLYSLSSLSPAMAGPFSLQFFLSLSYLCMKVSVVSRNPLPFYELHGFRLLDHCA
ncbi:hypothetical protein Csa_016940 [Cucumis sativus]|uniref:Uncharacterized protein n=1 Tax=Cucumis sativus TaxID=3659 RepID=A0A0A0LKA0_CUCSA|nr:hypothetical protein Csa_016940 [Cucumis sativus]